MTCRRKHIQWYFHNDEINPKIYVLLTVVPSKKEPPLQFVSAVRIHACALSEEPQLDCYVICAETV